MYLAAQIEVSMYINESLGEIVHTLIENNVFEL